MRKRVADGVFLNKTFVIVNKYSKKLTKLASVLKTT